MWRNFWTVAFALILIISLASAVDAQSNNSGNGNHGANPGNGNQGENPGNGNRGDNPGNGNQGENPGNGNQGENPGNGNRGDNPGNGNQGENQGNHGSNPRSGHSRGTPDGLTPAEEDICDDLKYATPGLYGLCIAFCEAQDSECVPDDTALDPYADCRMRDRRILERYDRRKQDGDPDMPCLPNQDDQSAEYSCPCWGEEQLQYFPFFLQPYSTDATYFSSGIEEYMSYWDEDDNGEEYLVCDQFETFLNEESDFPTGSYFVTDLFVTTAGCEDEVQEGMMLCRGSVGCSGGDCSPDLPDRSYFSMEIYPDEYEKCVASIQQLIDNY
jgi:hypothetical protein